MNVINLEFKNSMIGLKKRCLDEPATPYILTDNKCDEVENHLASQKTLFVRHNKKGLQLPSMCNNFDYATKIQPVEPKNAFEDITFI